MTFQIIGWEGHFENYKSKSYHRCSFVYMPNKQDGLGLRRVLSHEKGHTYFSVWCLTVQRCSKQEKPRHGWLTECGKPDGTPWDFDDLKLIWYIHPTLILEAYRFFCQPRVGWMTEVLPLYKHASSDTVVSAADTVVLEEEGENRGRPGMLNEPEAPPVETGSRVWKKHRPADLRKSLDDTWKEIAKNHGGETANAAVVAAKRLYGATVTHGQLSATYQAAFVGGYLKHPPESWPDHRAKKPREKAPVDDGLPVASDETIMEVLKSLPKNPNDGFIYDPRDQ